MLQRFLTITLLWVEITLGRMAKVISPSITAAILLGLLAVFVQAQNLEKLAPKAVPQEKPPAKIAAPPPAAVTPTGGGQAGDETVRLKKLRGLVFVSSVAKVKKAGIPEGPAIEAAGFPLLQSELFSLRMAKYLGQPASLKTLNELTRDVVLYYRENEMPVVDVLMPEQDINSGIVQIVVIEGRVGGIHVSGNHWVESQRILDDLRLHQGDLVDGKRLQDDLDWINTNPFRHVNAVFSRGGQPGETDVEIKTEDRLPVRFFTGYEDTGNDLTGDERWLAGFNWGDAFFLDHQLNYQFTTSSDFEKLVGHSGSYLIPLPWRHRLTFLGSYAESKADVPAPFNLQGRSWQTSARYDIPLPALGEYHHNFELGFDFKQSNNNLEFGGANVFNTTTDLAQWLAGYNGSVADPYGKTSFEITGFYGPGRWTSRSNAVSYQAARAFAKPEYAYAQFNVERLTRLPGDFSWSVRGLWQIADGNLLSSEQLGLGGSSTVRGYDEREANGDEGYLISNELRTPPVSLGQLVGLAAATDELQFLAFWDYGSTYNKQLLVGENPHTQLSGIGPGFCYRINSWLSIRFDYGFQLMDRPLDPRLESRGHLGFLLSY